MWGRVGEEEGEEREREDRKTFKQNIYWIYIMRKVVLEEATELHLRGIEGFLKRKVTKFGTGAKVDCPKEYLGKTVYLVIVKNGKTGKTGKTGKNGKNGEDDGDDAGH